MNETLTLDPEAEAAASAADEFAANGHGRTVGSNKKYNIPGDTVFAATASLPDEQRTALRWLHDYGSENNLSSQDLGGLLKKTDGSTYDGNTVFKVLTGRHEARLDNFVRAVHDLKKIIEERGTIKRLDFIETRLTKRIFAICKASLVYQQMNFIIGPSHIGKTTALEEYARRNNHGETVYIRLPEGGNITHTLHEFARVLKISVQSADLRSRIIRSFDDRMLCIVDEGHQPFLSAIGNSRIRSLEFIRELFDRSKCGIVISGTDVLDRELTMGTHRKLLEQFSRRALTVARLPAKPAAEDLKLIAQHYDLPAPKGQALQLQTEVIRDHALGRWCTFLRAASHLAHKQNKKLTWDHVIAAHATLKRLESGEE